MQPLNIEVESNIVIEIPRISTTHRYHSQLLGYATGRTVLITTPQDQNGTISVLKLDEIRLRFMDSQNACAFATRVQRVCTEPFHYLHLDYPKEIERIRLRAAKRLDSNLRALMSPTDGSASFHIRLIDVSPLGLGFVCEELVGKPEEHFHFEITLERNGQTKHLRLEAMLRSIHCVTDPHDQHVKHYRYGATLINSEAEQKLSIAELIYHHLSTPTLK